MRLYYRPCTGRPLRVAWALEEVGADYETVALSAEDCRDGSHRRRQLQAFASACTAVGDQLGGQPFLLGDRFTAADIVLGGVLAMARFTGALAAAPAHLVAYLDRLLAGA